MDEVTQRKGREGNRWLNERPTAEDVSEWFKTAVNWPDGLDAANYVGGVTLIEGKEKSLEPRGFKEDGSPLYTEVYNAVFTPYVKVETRVQFFHDLIASKGGKWIGFIEPVPQPEWESKLPPGFSKIVVAVSEGRQTAFICSTMQVTVYEAEGFEEERVLVDSRKGLYETRRKGRVVISAPPATKMIPLLSSGADPMSLMKAETGAVGRALGMAGMLIVPGAGIASAEDMREAQVFEGQVASAREGGEDAVPAAEGKARLDASTEPTHDELVTLASGTITRLKEEFEPEHTAFMAWVSERNFNGKLSEMKDADLKQVLKKAEAQVQAGTERVAGGEEPSDG